MNPSEKTPDSPIDPPGPGEGGTGHGDVREPPQPQPARVDLPSEDDDVEPEEDGGRIEKKA